VNARWVTAALIVAACVIWRPPPAEACSCAGVVPSSSAFRGATAVFVGTVEAVTGRMPEPVVATFQVDKVYRGTLGSHAIVSGDGTKFASSGETPDGPQAARSAP
jgi:hypothetical protein